MSFQGKKNIYTCEKCCEHIVTVDLEEGVTPFMIECKCTDGCKGMMKSSMYRVFDQSMKSGWEWYRPADLSDLSDWSKQHVSNGGLMLRQATPSPVSNVRGDLYDADAYMADGGDTPMTAAEAVLAWLLIEKIGVPDDVGYSPNQAQEIIVRRLDLARELEEIDVMLAEGQGDDEGHPIMPEFAKGITTYAKVEACLHLLERRRDALHPSPVSREDVPNDE